MSALSGRGPKGAVSAGPIPRNEPIQVPAGATMQLSSADKTLYVKIVYYGPGLSGKTTNLETLHRLTDPHRQQPLVSLRTEQDRTLFFDLLPFDLGKLYGLDIRLKLYTVPGQIQYDTTRKQVLAGADGVVFVADSQRSQAGENVRMVRYLKNNLLANGLDPATIPLLFQWNKRDLPELLAAEELDSQLNWRKVRALESVATVGTGVIETFREITIETLHSLARQHLGESNPLASTNVREKVTKILAPFQKQASPAAGAPSADQRPAGRTIAHVHQQAERVARTEGEDRHRNVLGLDALLSEAVQANLAISEQLAVASGAEEAVVDRLRRERKALSRLLQIAQVSTEPSALYKIALSTLLAGIEGKAGSVLASAGPAMPCREIAVMGCRADPLNSIRNPGVGSAASGLVDQGQAGICSDIRGELLFGQSHPALEALRSVMTIPLGKDAGGAVMMLLYAGHQGRDFSAEDLEFAELVTGVIGLALHALRTAV